MPYPHSSSRLISGKSLSVYRQASIVDTLFAAFPVELRVEVFRHCCGDYCPVDKNNAGPLLLMRVSRAWNQLVMQSPQLWSSFALDVQQPLTGSSQRLVDALKMWLDRSRNVSISFILQYPALDATCTKLLRELLLVSGRWRDVTLRAPSAGLLSLWKAGTFPALRSLTMETVGLAPFIVRDLGINWAQLIKLDLFLITIPTLDECLYVLQHAVNLIACKMNAILAWDEPAVERFTVPQLKELQLKLYNGDTLALGASESNLHAFLDALDCPVLRSFSIGWNVTLGPQRWSHLDKLVAFLRQLHALESLHLAYLPFDASQVLSALESVPALRHLRLSLSQADAEHDFINDELLRALTLPSPLLPLLESMRVNCHGQSFTNPALLRFIASRWKYQPNGRRGGCLQHLEIISPKRIAEYVPKQFRDLKEGKFDVAGSVKSESDMLAVLEQYLARDSYDHTCFLNCDFSRDIRSLFVL